MNIIMLQQPYVRSYMIIEQVYFYGIFGRLSIILFIFGPV